MSSIPKRFYIVVDGKHVAKPEHDDSGVHSEAWNALVGDKASITPAVFELEGDRLISGTWALGRHPAETGDTGFKAVVWLVMERAHLLHPVIVKEGEDGSQLRFGGSSNDKTGRPLGLQHDRLYVSVEDEVEQNLTVELVAAEE
ncbi:uncharacterized protein BKA55DRAFT_341553 [Fusarium redolens]|uniref:Uncharacterized protein n=1 Tax=Fusarium redolens TaxID=48865 RepID=A0A9P9KI94_FUSRE|nr:uncharacterized protein BKA55DRAFT_341553 [Fusarium redolens]KAH7253529.1 hypothetical protein BKA55DRAFT_341553 [Fusarium redolens]